MNEEAVKSTDAVAVITDVQRKSDGQDGKPVLANTPGAQNAALKEPAPKPGEGVNPQHPCRGRLSILDADKAIVSETAPDGSRRKKIAICGFASSTRKYMPMNDPSWSIWGLNQLYRHIPRGDRWFDIHHNWKQEVVEGTDHYGWARDCGIPFYLQTRDPALPTAVRYPLDRVLAAFESDYFTSSIAYMVALAILEIDEQVRLDLNHQVAQLAQEQLASVDVLGMAKRLYEQYTIGLFGIDLTVGQEYFHEKPCAEYWIGQASGRGIQMAIPPESALCKQSHRYGYERAPSSLIKVSDIVSHSDHLTQQRDEMVKRLYMLEGALESNKRWQEMAELRERGTVVV